MKGYTSQTKIENYLLIDIDESFEDQITAWIEEIEAYIEQMTGRVFVADSEVSQRRYTGDGTSILLIDDCIEITEVKLSKDDDALTVDDDYVLLPQNAVVRGVPINKIQLIAGRFGVTPQDTYITAKWGYSEDVKADIATVATVLVAGIVNYAWNAEGEVKSESIGRYTVTYKDKTEWADFERAKQILDSYKKYTF